jgi:DNA polymerase (family 10)
MKNAEIAAAFEELGTLYELDGAVVYRVLAYRNAAKAIRDSGVSVAELARQGRAEELPGIGKTIAEKIEALLLDGEIPAAVKLKERIPPGLIKVTRIPGLGPKRARQLHDALGIETIEQLRDAAEAQQIRTVPGFGAKAEEKVLAALAAGADGSVQARVLLSTALEVGNEIVDGLRASGAAEQVELAGSARRWADTCKDLDIVAAVAASDPADGRSMQDSPRRGDTSLHRTPGEADPEAATALTDALAALPQIDDVTTTGTAGARAITHQGLAVELRIVTPDSFGNLLQHFTGSGRHNEALRTAAVRQGLHVSEYGILDDATGETLRCADEPAVYERLGMAYVEPELREDRGELEAARAGALPDLIALDDIRGDLHCHTTASDGHQTVLEMARAARQRGYEYLAITDHSASHGFGNDVSPEELVRQIERVAEANEQIGDGFRVLSGSEVNILPDGSLDYSDELLAELDWVIASAHTSFGMSEDDMTKRIVTAIENPLVRAIGHPTGRMLGRREPYAIDMDRVIDAAARTGTFLEINSNPNRRDLHDVHARAAAAAGVKLVIDSDAHRTQTLAVIRYGIATARRAWLAKDDVANTRGWSELASAAAPASR